MAVPRLSGSSSTRSTASGMACFTEQERPGPNDVFSGRFPPAAFRAAHNRRFPSLPDTVRARAVWTQTRLQLGPQQRLLVVPADGPCRRVAADGIDQDQ